MPYRICFLCLLFFIYSSIACCRGSPILIAAGVEEQVARNALRLSVGRHTSFANVDTVVLDLKQAVTQLANDSWNRDLFLYLYVYVTCTFVLGIKYIPYIVHVYCCCFQIINIYLFYFYRCIKWNSFKSLPDLKCFTSSNIIIYLYSRWPLAYGAQRNAIW